MARAGGEESERGEPCAREERENERVRVRGWIGADNAKYIARSDAPYRDKSTVIASVAGVVQ